MSASPRRTGPAVLALGAAAVTLLGAIGVLTLQLQLDDPLMVGALPPGSRTFALRFVAPLLPLAVLAVVSAWAGVLLVRPDVPPGAARRAGWLLLAPVLWAVASGLGLPLLRAATRASLAEAGFGPLTTGQFTALFLLGLLAGSNRLAAAMAAGAWLWLRRSSRPAERPTAARTVTPPAPEHGPEPPPDEPIPLDVGQLHRRLAAHGAAALVREPWLSGEPPDGGPGQDDEARRELGAVLRLAAGALERDPDELPGQLIGRLGATGSPHLTTLVEQARAWSPGTGLRPAAPSLLAPGGPLLARYQVDTGAGARAVASAGAGRLAVGLDDGRVLLTDLWGSEPSSFQAHRGPVLAVALSADGRFVVSGGEDRRLRLWELDAGGLAADPIEPIDLARCSDPVGTVALSPDGRWVLAGCDDGELRLWDLLASGEVDAPAAHGTAVEAVALRADGRAALSAGDQDGLLVWDLDRVGEQSAARTWYELPGEAMPDLLAEDEHFVTAAALDPTGATALTGNADGRLTVWDLTTPGTILASVPAHQGPVATVAFSPDGRRCASGALSSAGEHGGPTMLLWDADRLRATAPAATGALAAAVSPTGRALFLTPDHQPMILDPGPPLWPTPPEGEAGAGRVSRLSQPIGRGADAVALSADGELAVCSSVLGTWSWAPGSSLMAVGRGPLGTAGPIAVSADGSAVVAGGDGRLLVWRGPGTQPRQLAGQSGTVTALAVGTVADGLMAVTGADDGTMRLWDLEVEQVAEVKEWPTHGITAMALAPDRERTALSGWADGTVVLWAFEEGELVVLDGHRGAVTGLAVSPDGRLAVSCAADHTVALWDIEVMERLAGFTIDAPVLACALRQGGDRLTVLAADAAARVHELRLALPSD